MMKQFFPSSQVLRTTTHGRVALEPTMKSRTSPDFGIAETSSGFVNLTCSLFVRSFWPGIKSEGIRRLISTIWDICSGPRMAAGAAHEDGNARKTRRGHPAHSALSHH